MNKSNEAVSNSDGQQATLGTELVRVLKLGLDMHYRQVTVGMQEDCGPLKAVGKMGHEHFLRWVQKKPWLGQRAETSPPSGLDEGTVGGLAKQNIERFGRRKTVA